MGFAFAASFNLHPTCPITVKRTSQLIFSPNSSLARQAVSIQKPISISAATATKSSNPTSSFRLEETENRKFELLRAIQDTQRGLVASAEQRSCIEEALVSVEAFDAGAPIDLTKLNGTWRLQYTSAPDVLVLFDAAAKLPFFQVGQIFQKFECEGQSDGGYVRNVVRWSIPNLLEEQEGATLLVSAKFSLVSPRNIFLQFEDIAIKNIFISEEVQALIAPAVLPRTFWTLQLLQYIRSFEAKVPVTNSGRRSPGGLYYLSYLDGNMLLGRALAGGGIFIFSRAHALI